MEAFFCIVLSYAALKAFWKSERKKAKERKSLDLPATNLEKIKAIGDIDKAAKEEEVQDKLRKDVEKQKERDAEHLRKQGYSDELIAVILPTINNGQ